MQRPANQSTEYFKTLEEAQKAKEEIKAALAEWAKAGGFDKSDIEEETVEL